ncbi:MAG TPA: hypothetical protein VL463_07535 [Kofleriaceae bacterium]|jgi:hypothetical protein|nr:hypothetical protein [Kofleriaceae bacterium]
MSEALKVPTAAVPVGLALADGSVVKAHLFVPERGLAGRALALELAALLDGDAPFLPAREAGGHVCLYAKHAIAYVTIGFGPGEPESDLQLFDHERSVEVVLERGPTLVGGLLYTSPADRPRVLDHMNQAGAFLRLWTAETLYVIGKSHVLRVREIG